MAHKVANMTFSDQQQVKNQNPGHYSETYRNIIAHSHQHCMCL